MSYHSTRAKSNISISKTSQRFFEGGKDMSQRDGFASGFFAGAVFGSVVGGIVGALVSKRRDTEFIEDEQQLNARPMEAKKASPNRRQMGSSEVESMETARRSLEDKIAQLNATIDEVREQLGNVNSTSTPSQSERASL
jgi:predicted RNase H-like nuclease (RuvC/YqgF family)